MARAFQRVAAEEHHPHRPGRLHRDAVAGPEDQQARAFIALVRDLDLAVDQIDRALFMIGIERYAGSRIRSHLSVEPRRYHRNGRGYAERLAGDDARRKAAFRDHRQIAGRIMLKRRRDFLGACRQRDPALQAQHFLTVTALSVGRALGMGDAAAGGHQVHGAGLDFLNVALAVAVQDAAVEQIGDGGQANMRMRADVHALAGEELHRAEMVEEDEGADHLPLAMRQRAADLKSVAEIAGARHDDEIERVAGFGIAEHGVVGGLPAHGETPLVLQGSY